MVEAAVILPLLAGFYGLLQFAHAEYDVKILTSWDVENATATYAAHGCVGSDEVTPGEADQNANMAFEALGKAPANDPAHGFAQGFLNYSGAFTGAPGIVGREATATAKWSKYSRQVGSKDWMFCNEQNYESKGLLQGAAKFFGSYVDNLVHHAR